MTDALKAYITVAFGSAQAIKDAKTTEKKFVAVADKIKQSFSFGGLGGGLFAGLSMKAAYDNTLKLAQASEKLNFDVERLSQFNNLMTQFGGNADGTTDAVLTINNALRQFRLESNGALKELSARIQGFNPFKANGELKDEIGIIEDLRKALKNLDKDQQIEALEILGLGDNAALLRYIRASREEYAKMAENAGRMSHLTEKQKENILRIQTTVARVKQSFMGVGASFLEAVEPALNFVNNLLEGFNSLDDGIKKVAASISMVASLPVLSKLFIGGKGLGISGLAATVMYGAYRGTKFLTDKLNDRTMEKHLDYLKSDKYLEKRWRETGAEEILKKRGFTDDEIMQRKYQFFNQANAGVGNFRDNQTTPTENTNNNIDNSSISNNKTVNNVNYEIKVYANENNRGLIAEMQNLLMNTANGVR